ncbi:MAG: pilus assembly protein [Lachnospiraceae bacterium]|nr:pilus assembly protein [Lachnospiraceae bacterium]
MKKKNRGVITVEAALVMPVILGVLFLLYSLAIIQYNNVVARSEAMRVANRVAMNWNTIGGTGWNIFHEDQDTTVYQSEVSDALNFLLGKTRRTGEQAIDSSSYKEHDPYRFFIELFTTGSTKKSNIQNYVNTQMGNLATVESGMNTVTESSVTSDAGYHIFNRYVSVTIKNTYKSPMMQMLANMGLPMEDTYSVTAKAKLTEPADFVRNVSFLEELLRNLKENKNKSEN